MTRWKSLTMIVGVLAALGSVIVSGQQKPVENQSSVTKAQFDEWFKTMSNWGRWGKDDERGALNLITPQKAKAAAALVKTGQSVSLEKPVTRDMPPSGPQPRKVNSGGAYTSFFLADPDVHVGILKGRDGGSFCAGDDIKNPLPERSRQQELEGYLFLHHAERDGSPPHRPAWDIDIMKLERYKPIIGAVDRYCLGQGMIYLLHLTDLRIASERAQFGLPEVGLGIIPAAGGSQTLPRAVGRAAALDMLLAGGLINAREAKRLRLVNRVVPRADLLPVTEKLARKIMASNQLAVKYTKQAITRGLDLSLCEGLELESRLGERLLQASPDTGR